MKAIKFVWTLESLPGYLKRLQCVSSDDWTNYLRELCLLRLQKSHLHSLRLSTSAHLKGPSSSGFCAWKVATMQFWHEEGFKCTDLILERNKDLLQVGGPVRKSGFHVCMHKYKKGTLQKPDHDAQVHVKHLKNDLTLCFQPWCLFLPCDCRLVSDSCLLLHWIFSYYSTYRFWLHIFLILFSFFLISCQTCPQKGGFYLRLNVRKTCEERKLENSTVHINGTNVHVASTCPG